MARVTVEDCVEKVEDRFELVVLAAQRAKDIAAGSELKIDRKDEKNTVLALREIAAELISAEDLRENLVKHHQKERFVAPIQNSDGTEISEDELEQEDFELKEIEASEKESAINENVGEEVVEAKAAKETADELEQAANISFEDDNLEIDD